jgi:hypothetical protein
VADRDKWRDEERYRRDEDERSRYREYADERRDQGRYGQDYGVPGGYRREGSSGEDRGGYGRDYGRREYSPSYGPGRSYSEPSRGYGKEGYGEDRGAYGGEGYGERRSGSRYGREGYGSPGYGRGGYGGEERGWWERASDEVSSWFGDQEAEAGASWTTSERVGIAAAAPRVTPVRMIASGKRYAIASLMIQWSTPQMLK